MDVVVRSVVRCHRLVSGRAAGGDHRLLVIRNRHRERSTGDLFVQSCIHWTGVDRLDGHRGDADRILAVGISRCGIRRSCRAVGDCQRSAVSSRSEFRHREVNGSVVLAWIGVEGAVGQTAGNAQRFGLRHRHGGTFNRTAVGVGDRHLVATSNKICSRVGRLVRSIIPLIGVRSGAAGRGHRGGTVATIMAGYCRACDICDGRQCGHRHVDDDG